MKLNELETAIIDKFPNVNICEIRQSDDDLHILGVVPARNEYDGDHIVEWGSNGIASECLANDRDYREIGWNEEEQRPEYIKAKLLIRNTVFDVKPDASTKMQ